MISSLRGSVCSYQGEELGLTEADIAFADVQEPYGITFWPQFKGRDGCRTPHPWQHDLANAGFSEGKPWLPVSKEHFSKSVNVQDKESDSVLNSYRHFNRWRKEQPALRYGDINFIDTAEPILAFVRQYQGEQLLVCFNFSDQMQTMPLSLLGQGTENLNVLTDHNLAGGSIIDDTLHLPSFGCFYCKL